MLKVLLKGGQIAKSTEEFSKGSLARYSGYASTKDLDSVNDIVEPSAFESSMKSFMQHPIILFGHDWYGQPIGKVVAYKIDDKGLYIDFEIADTTLGQDIVSLIEFGILKALSIGFIPKRVEQGYNGEPTVIHDLDLLEISVVNVPANREALFKSINKYKIEMKTLTPSSLLEDKNKGTKMDPEEVKRIAAAEAAAALKDNTVIKSVSTKVDTATEAVVRLEQVIKDAKSDKLQDHNDVMGKIDKIAADFKTATDALAKDIADKKLLIPDAVADGAFTVKDILGMSNATIKDCMSSARSEKAIKFRDMNDDIVMLDALMCTNKSYADQAMPIRIKSLNRFKEYGELRKALDSATSGEGSHLVPTGMSSNLGQMVRVRGRVAQLHGEFTLPTAPFTFPVQLTSSIAQLMGQTTAVVSSFDTDEQTPTTGDITFTPKKARSRIQVSSELTEDAAFAILPWLQGQVVDGIADAIEIATINGDLTATHMDTIVSAATDFQRAWNGYRDLAHNGLSNTVNAGGAISAAEIRTLRQGNGKYGLYPSESAIVTSIRGYLKNFLGDLTDVQTVDKYGAQATILTGELAKVDGLPLVVSEFVRENMNASGVHDGVTTTTTSALLVYKNGFLYGVQRGIQVGVEYDLINDVYQLVCYKRLDMQSMFTGQNIVASMYNMI